MAKSSKPKKGKHSLGSVRAKAGLPAKAGHRKLRKLGLHRTTPESRASGKPSNYPPPAKPLDQIRLVLTGRQPELEALFGEAAWRAG